MEKELKEPQYPYFEDLVLHVIQTFPHKDKKMTKERRYDEAMCAIYGDHYPRYDEIKKGKPRTHDEDLYYRIGEFDLKTGSYFGEIRKIAAEIVRKKNPDYVPNKAYSARTVENQTSLDEKYYSHCETLRSRYRTRRHVYKNPGNLIRWKMKNKGVTKPSKKILQEMKTLETKAEDRKNQFYSFLRKFGWTI